MHDQPCCFARFSHPPPLPCAPSVPLGCILYELTSLKHAFDALNLNGLATKVIQGVYPPIATSYSRDLRDLIKSMLGVTPSSRPSVKQILLMPQLFKPIRKYIRSIVLQPQDTDATEDGEPTSSSGFRPAHVLNLRNQLDRLGPPLSGIFPEIERERAEKKSSGSAASAGKASKAAASASSAAAGAAAGSDLYDAADDDSCAGPYAIDRTLVAGSAAVAGSHPPTIRRGDRKHHQRAGSNGRPAKGSDSLANDDSSVAAAPPAAAPGVGVRRHKGLQTRLAALDREHALRLEELRAEEEAKRKLEQDFERLQALQAQRAAKRIQQGRRAGGARPPMIPAPDASIASTVTTGSAGSTASGSAAANLPIIAANGSVSPLSPPAPIPVSFTSSMAALPSLSQLQQPGHGHAPPLSSRESSRHASPALGPHRLNKGANRMPAMVLGAPVVATSHAHAMDRSASPAPQPPLHPSAAPASSVAAGTASGSNSAAPSPRFASRRLAAAVAGAVPASSAGDESKESSSGGGSNFRSASPRTVSASPQPPPASAASSASAGTDENRHLKLLKRKAALKAAPFASASPAEQAPSAAAGRSRSQVPSPELGGMPPRITGIPSVPIAAPRLTGGAGRPRVAHPISVPVPSGAASSAASASAGAVVGAAGTVLSPGSVLESEVAAERAELARLRVERERLEDLLTKMDDVLFEGQLDQPLSAAAAGTKSPYSGSSEIDTPTHGSASAPPAVSTAHRSSGPVLHSPPSGSGSGSGSVSGAPSSFSASTILPSAFDAPLQYRGRAAAAPGGSAAAVALKQRRRHSAQNPGLMLDAAAAQSSAMQHQQSQQQHHPSAPSSIAPRHRTFVNSSSASGGGGPVSGFPPNSVFSPAGPATPSGSASVTNAQGSSRDRILAMKASRKNDVEAAEAARLLAARREYFSERTKADQRTKDFYGNSSSSSYGTHRSPSPGSSPPPPPDADAMQRHQSDPLSYPGAAGSRYPPPTSSASVTAAAAIAADNLLIYDDRHLHLHLNTDLSPSRAAIAAADRELPSHSASDYSAGGDDADPHDATVREFKNQLAQYTRRIETLRSAIEVSSRVATATAMAGRGGVGGGGLGAEGGESAGESDEDASDEDDDDDDADRSEGGEDADDDPPAPAFNLADRRKVLAAECVSLLGRSAFIAAYDFLVDAQSDPAYANDSWDDARKLEKLTTILGPDRVKHWKLIDQLIFMESC